MVKHVLLPGHTDGASALTTAPALLPSVVQGIIVRFSCYELSSQRDFKIEHYGRLGEARTVWCVSGRLCRAQ